MRILLFIILITYSFTFAQELEVDQEIVEVGGVTELKLKAPIAYQAIPYESNSKNFTFGKKVISDTIDQTVMTKIPVIILDTGKIKIGPFLFLNGEDTVKSNTIYISPKEVQIDTTLAIKDIESYESTHLGIGDYLILAFNWMIKHWYFALIPPILLTLLLIFLLRKRKEVKVAQVRKKTLAELTLERIFQLEESSYLKESQFNLYYFELTYIIRWYLEQQFNTPLLNKTNEEMEQELERLDLNQDLKVRLKAIFSNSILIKFAKQSTDVNLAESDLIQFKNYISTLDTEKEQNESH